MQRHAPGTARSPHVRMTFASAALALAAVTLVPSLAHGQGNRTHPAGRQLLMVEGTAVTVRALEGGDVVGEVVAVAGPDGSVKKQIARTRFTDAVVQAPMDDVMQQWIAQSWAGTAKPKSAAVVATDFSFRSLAERQLMNVMLTATTIPTLDGASRDAAYFTVRLNPGAVVSRKGAGGDLKAAIGLKQKAWLRSNFRFELADLPANRVARIDSFTVRTDVVGMQGEERAVRQAGAVQFPNLRLSISMADHQPWADWADAFIAQGQNGDGAEKNGAIVFLQPNMKDEFGRIALSGCGIVSLTRPFEANSEAIARFDVELYCEKMGLEVKP